MSEEVSAGGRSSSFAERVADRAESLNTRVCLGIDPRATAHPLTHPDRFEGDPAKTARAVVHYFQAVIAATSDIVACYKLQSAFFEAMGIPGMIALAQLLADIRASEVPVILDGKRGDIGSTAEAYSAAYLSDGVFAADALTVSPYLGLDTLQPFITAASQRRRGVLVLLKTSNPGSGDLQDLRLENGQPLWRNLAGELEKLAEASLDSAGFTPVGAVVGVSHKEELAEIRRLMPRSLLLLPGYGAQGGDASSIAAAFTDRGQAIVSASRSLTYVGEADDFAEQSRSATVRMRDQINEVLRSG